VASPTFGTDVSSDNAFIRYMVVSLAFEASDWLAFAFGYRYLLVADDKTIENCFVCAVWVRKGDDYVSYHLVWISPLGGLSPPAFADGSIG
jgi:hypothetical protein